MKKINWKSIVWVILITIGVLFVSQGVHAIEFDPGGEIKTATELPDPEGGVNQVVINVIQWLLGLLGLVAVIMIIFGGFTWMTAGGNEERIEKAKKILKASIIGLIIILLAWAIVTFIIGRVDTLTT